MGTDKALLRFEGEVLVQRALGKLNQVCAQVAIAGGVAELSRFAPVIADLYPGQGPLGGIVSALTQSAFEWNLFLAVDMPFVPVEALQALLSAAGGDAAAVLTEHNGICEPLCAAYRRSALPVLRRELEGGNRRVRGAAEAAGSIVYWRTPMDGWFANLNTPEDVSSARRKSSPPE